MHNAIPLLMRRDDFSLPSSSSVGQLSRQGAGKASDRPASPSRTPSSTSGEGIMVALHSLSLSDPRVGSLEFWPPPQGRTELATARREQGARVEEEGRQWPSGGPCGDRTLRSTKHTVALTTRPLASAWCPPMPVLAPPLHLFLCLAPSRRRPLRGAQGVEAVSEGAAWSDGSEEELRRLLELLPGELRRWVMTHPTLMQGRSYRVGWVGRGIPCILAQYSNR
jgi:hypothetical protein